MARPANRAAGVKTVVLGGKKYDIPELAVRQLREVRLQILEMSDKITAAHEVINEGTEDAPDFRWKLKDGMQEPILTLSRDDYDRLILQVVWIGLTRNLPDMTYDEFLNLPATDGEVFAAWLVVRDQSGIFLNPSDSKEKKPSSGEA